MKVKVVYEVEQKRPKDATPDRLRRLKASGMKVSEMVSAYGISPQRIYQLLKHKSR